MHSTDYFNRTYSKLLNIGCSPPFSHIFGTHHLLLGLPHLSCSSNTELLGVLWILYNIHTSAPLFMLFSLPRISFFFFPLGYLHIFWDQVQNLLFLEAFFMYQPVCEIKSPSSCLPLCSTLFLTSAFITWCDHFPLWHEIMSFFNEGNVHIFLYPQA